MVAVSKWIEVILFIIFYFIYIPWIIRGKPHLEIGIVNIDGNAMTQNCTYNMNTNMVMRKMNNSK